MTGVILLLEDYPDDEALPVRGPGALSEPLPEGE